MNDKVEEIRQGLIQNSPSFLFMSEDAQKIVLQHICCVIASEILEVDPHELILFMKDKIKIGSIGLESTVEVVKFLHSLGESNS
jgi:hypothetical protein